jgi:hypothetical protein
MAALIYRNKLSCGASSVGFNIRVNNFLNKLERNKKKQKNNSATVVQTSLRRFFG